MSYMMEGEKVGLRGLKETDREDYRAWMENPEATQFMETGTRPVGDLDLEKVMRASTNNDENIVFVIEEKTTKRPIGIIGLYMLQWICRRGEFRVLIGAPGMRGKGYGTEAADLILDYGFNKLNLETIYLGVNTENTAAVRSYEKAGFVKEGVRRKLVYRNGRYYDVVMMSILREEFANA